VADDSDHRTYGPEIPETGLSAYHLSHVRGHRILARIQEMLACCALGQRMFHVRSSIKYRRIAELHQRCADMEHDPGSDPELLHLFEEYIPISGALTSDEYDKLLSGAEPLSKPLNPLKGSRMCQACRSLNLRRASFQNGTPGFVTSTMGDLSIDEEYSDEELMREFGQSATVHDMKHHKLGSLKDIATRSECLFCQLVFNCFMRLSETEIVGHGFDWAIPDFCFDGVIWLSVVPDSAGDHPKALSSKGYYQISNHLDDLDSPVTTGRTRIILSLLPEGEEPRDSSFEPPVKTLHTEIFPYTEDDEDATFHVRQWSTSYIDTKRPQKWLHACETYHGDACSVPPNYKHMEVYEDMLLIDIEDECLVSGFKSRRYFALSYVWGSSQATSFQTKKATLKDAMTPGGLSWDKKGLAKTISDAIQFTHEMKVRYLWVDALCIVQDDEDSKDRQIMHMDAIYRQAILTIVAGDNIGAADGICGLGSRPRENFQRTYEYRPGLILTANEAVIGDAEVEVMQTKVSNFLEM
jgi:Heterokaryon incompatibility protein (HET)